MSFWDYEIVINTEYKWQVEHILICEIHMNMRQWIMTFWDVKLWIWDMVVIKRLVNPWCDITCVMNYELYDNPIGVYIDKSVYAQGIKREM